MYQQNHSVPAATQRHPVRTKLTTAPSGLDRNGSRTISAVQAIAHIFIAEGFTCLAAFLLPRIERRSVSATVPKASSRPAARPVKRVSGRG